MTSSGNAPLYGHATLNAPDHVWKCPQTSPGTGSSLCAEAICTISHHTAASGHLEVTLSSTVDTGIDLSSAPFLYNLSFQKEKTALLQNTSFPNSLVTLFNHISFRVNTCSQLYYVRTQERDLACSKHWAFYFMYFKVQSVFPPRLCKQKPLWDAWYL